MLHGPIFHNIAISVREGDKEDEYSRRYRRHRPGGYGAKPGHEYERPSSFDLAVPATLITEAVFARSLSARKEERVVASKILSGPHRTFTGDKTAFVEDIRAALLASKIISYAQGFMLMREAAKAYGWELNFGDIAMLWRSGCIIRSYFWTK